MKQTGKLDPIEVNESSDTKRKAKIGPSEDEEDSPTRKQIMEAETGSPTKLKRDADKAVEEVTA